MTSNETPTNGTLARSSSFSQASQSSHTAQDFIASQLSLEADAREALPYQFDTCTKPLGPLRQSVYACLTCTPPPASIHQQFTPAGVCYSCSISCHGEHNLVELFAKRDFECDCGTTRFASSGALCSLRPNPATGKKGDVTGEPARKDNKYNQNFEGKFCGCGEEYDPEKEKGTMFQCLGLGHIEDGGCGEDWWHPECLMGLPRIKPEDAPEPKVESNGALETVKEENEDGAEHNTTNGTGAEEAAVVEEPPLPPGFPGEDDFDHFICYKCVGAYPWLKQYAGTTGFLPAVSADGAQSQTNGHAGSKKRKAENDLADSQDSSKKVKPEREQEEKPAISVAEATEAVQEAEAQDNVASGNGDVPMQREGVLGEHTAEKDPTVNGVQTNGSAIEPKHASLPEAKFGPISLFLKEDFRDHLCRCTVCFPRLAKHSQLLEEEDTYEPPVSESDHNENASVGGRSVNSGSLLDRGEAALSSMDRVRAIEGVMAYNHVRDKVKAFLQPFAESGKAVGAEDIKEYFAKLRGDEAAQREAAAGASADGAVQGDGRKEQDGY